LDLRQGSLGEARRIASSVPQGGRLIRKTAQQGGSATLYIVAASKADQAVQIIKSRMANPADTIEDLAPVSGFLVQAFNLAPGDYVRIEGKNKPREDGFVGGKTTNR
jgi:hypothetical protein